MSFPTHGLALEVTGGHRNAGKSATARVPGARLLLHLCRGSGLLQKANHAAQILQESWQGYHNRCWMVCGFPNDQGQLGNSFRICQQYWTDHSQFEWWILAEQSWSKFEIHRHNTRRMVKSWRIPCPLADFRPPCLAQRPCRYQHLPAAVLGHGELHSRPSLANGKSWLTIINDEPLACWSLLLVINT